MQIDVFSTPTKQELEEYVQSMFGRIRNVSLISGKNKTGTYVFRLDEADDNTGRAKQGSLLLKMNIPLRHISASRRKKYSDLFQKEIDITSHLGTFHKDYYPKVHSAGVRGVSKNREKPATVKHGKFPEETYFMLVEYLKGTGLDKLIEENNLSFESRIDVALHISYGLNRLHNVEGITHQDIKPENIILDDRNKPRIIDLETADYALEKVPLCRAGILTPIYCSPEQAEQIITGVPVHVNDPRTDIFSFGLLLYELFSGRHIYEEAISKLTFTSNLLRYFMSKPPHKIETTGNSDIDNIVYRATRAKDERYSNMEHVISDLEKVKPKLIMF